MALEIITVDDLRAFAPDIKQDKAEAMIADALALAQQAAPCMAENDFPFAAAAKAIIRGAILRWNEAGTGAAVQLGAGPFQQTLDTRQPRKGMFWPSEITQLQALCQGRSQRAFTIDTTPVRKPTDAHPLEHSWVNGPSGMEPTLYDRPQPI